MTSSAVVYESGEKTHRDENFPVASYLISKEYRAPILAFYQFARGSDDIADDPKLAPQEKITQLNHYEATLLGQEDSITDAIPLRESLASSKITPRHGQDLLIAFRQDAVKPRYETWEELVGYCMHSAAPVGRYVLDVHKESKDCWPASDAICSALQIINHLQDCKTDYQRMDRVYIPKDHLVRHQVSETDLAASHASPGLRNCLKELAVKTQNMLIPLSPQVRNRRLKMEVLAIEKIAHALLRKLENKDPLSERVHLTKIEFAAIILSAAFGAYL